MRADSVRAKQKREEERDGTGCRRDQVDGQVIRLLDPSMREEDSLELVKYQICGKAEEWPTGCSFRSVSDTRLSLCVVHRWYGSFTMTTSSFSIRP